MKNPRLLGPVKYWTPKNILEDAKRFQTRGAWMEGSACAYTESLKLGKTFHAKACAHMAYSSYYNNPPPKPKGYWTRARCIQEARKYNTPGEWRKGNIPSYLTAYKKGWKEECLAHMVTPNHVRRNDAYWTVDRLVQHIQRSPEIRTLKDWQRRSPKVYAYAAKKRIVTFVAIRAGLIND